MKLTNPIIINYMPKDSTIQRKGDNMLLLPTNPVWSEYMSSIKEVFNDPNYDYAIVSYRNVPEDELNNSKTIKSLDIQAKSMMKEATNKGLRVFNRHDDQLYFLNPSFDEVKSSGKPFVPNDDDVLAKRDSFDDEYSWQKHQGDIIKKFAAMMPLTSGDRFEKTNHKAMLTAPSRGLKPNDLKDFFSWKSNQVVIPGLMQDNMVGIPSIKATSFKDLELEYDGKPLNSIPLSLKTVGMEGAMIPMKNPRGDSPKYQIATDVSPINVILKARAEDGISIQKSEFFNKKSKEYNFTINGEPSHLTVVSANNDGVTFQDTEGTFTANMKQDVKPVLLDRGYDLPPLIDSLTTSANSKYIWMSPGTMLGSKDINNSKVPEKNRISPSVAGFITSREPKNGSDEYVVLVAEGALKGVITAKYLNAQDATGRSVADYIGKDRGIIVAQVPGVADSFVKSVSRIYDEKNVIGTYIAMDADGRDNLAVARGIHSAFSELQKYGNGQVKVMSWDPSQKGIDDALISVANHQISVDDMDIHFGSPEKLFPLDQATAPNPYKLDGSRANKVAWADEYTKDKQERDAKIKDIQSNSDDIQLSFDGLEGPSKTL